MKRLLTPLLCIVSVLFIASCSNKPIYYNAMPLPISTMTIPSEGGRFKFEVVAYIPYEETRFQPGEWYKEYRYRVVEDGDISKESTLHDTSISYGAVWIEFSPNDTNHTKEYDLEIQIADDFHSVGEDQHFGEWQTIWEITQPCLAGQ